MTSVLLVTSNGTGMGHLTRQAAVALSLGKEHRATVFSLSLGLPLVTDLGVAGEYCPSYEQPWIASREWHGYLRDRLIAIVEETGSEAVLFDGVAPYPGIGQAAATMRDVAFIWLRRGMWKEANRVQLRKKRYFDLVIEPGDLGSRADRGPTSGLGDAAAVGPMSILEPLGLLPRETARARLGLPPDVPVALVTLGSGRLGEVAGPGVTAVETLLEQTKDWHVAITRSPVALEQVGTQESSRIIEIRGVYPLARYLAAFDLAVSSAGYNAVHELVPAGVATLLVANTSTRTDDQTARAGAMENEGLALATEDKDLAALESKLGTLLDDETRHAMAGRARETMQLMTGASDTGAAIVSFAEGFDTRRRSASALVSFQLQRAKDGVKDLLGEERTAALKKALGRHPTPVHERTRVRIVDTLDGSTDDSDEMNLTVTHSLTADDIPLSGPVEHILPGSAADYEQRRLEIVREYYDVVG